MARAPWVWLVLGSWLVAGCHDPVKPAITAYDQSRYPEAAAEFRNLEPNVSELDPRSRARYALYRGLNHLALGDAHGAERWLRRASALSARCPERLSVAENERLRAAWRSLGHMPGDR